MAVLSRKRDAVNIDEAPLIITGGRLDEAHSSYCFVCELDLPREYFNFGGTLEELKNRIQEDMDRAEKRVAQYASALQKLKTL